MKVESSASLVICKVGFNVKVFEEQPLMRNRWEKYAIFQRKLKFHVQKITTVFLILHHAVSKHL